MIINEVMVLMNTDCCMKVVELDILFHLTTCIIFIYDVWGVGVGDKSKIFDNDNFP